jgi:sulfate transport system substrate-binding protein
MHSKLLLVAVATILILGGSVLAQSKLLNVSYDPTRELYKAYDDAFAKAYKRDTGKDVAVETSHGGSGAQSRKVQDGLEADVVTLALAADVDALVNARLIDAGWQDKLPNRSTPFTSTIVFLVRKGNPKQLKGWNDLVRPGVEVITPNPKTSGGARWNYLAAYGWAVKENKGDAEKAKAYLTSLFQHVPVLDSGARGATNTFVKGQGDVLLAWENEALLAVQGRGAAKFEVVYPSYSILAEPPVAIVDRNVDKHGSRDAALAYLKFAWTPEAQEIAAKNFYRPTNEAVATKFAGQFKKIELFALTDLFKGGWAEVQKDHFADGGVFDQILAKK